MTEPAIVDTGPLIALFRSSDAHHRLSKIAFSKLTRTPWTCLPVITEAAYLLGKDPTGLASLFGAIENEIVEVRPLDTSDILAARDIVLKYRCDFADACVVVLAQQARTETILTLDQRDFRMFPKSLGGPFLLLPER